MPARSRTPSGAASRRSSEGSFKISVTAPAPGGGGGGAGSDVRSAAQATGMMTRKPASGPATPMSKSARREGMGERILMKAPSVPARKGGGTGMKKGSVASTP